MDVVNGDGGGSSHGSSSKSWFRALRNRPSRKFRDDQPWNHRSSPASNDNTFHDLPALNTVDSRAYSDHGDSNARQLYQLVQKIRAAPSGPSNVDAAYKEASKHFEKAAALCVAVLSEELKPMTQVTSTTDGAPRDSSADPPKSPAVLLDSRSSFSGRSLGEAMSGSGGTRTLPFASDTWLSPIRDWKTCLDSLSDAFRTSLAETYKSYERDATPEMIESLFTSKKFRREAVHRMRNASVTRVLSADPQFFPRYEIRFRNYEKLRTELGNVRQILQKGESGISPNRTIVEFPISPRGDAVLEFANLNPDGTSEDPVLRFRISPHVLAETSPIFARMFSGHGYSLHHHDAEDITPHLPAPPTKFYCADGSEVWLYRMPQYESNQYQAMEIMMHAAHMHNTFVPRDVSFEQFVAIAECSIKYKTTSPLELIVEHRWLPQWMHKGADDMPDGLLIISYAFGSRGLFTRMSKSAVLNLKDENDLNSKPWPQKIKDKVWAVRNAKVAQLYECCTATLQEYLQPPTCEPVVEPEFDATTGSRSGLHAPSTTPRTAMPITTTPRCPKGSHWCDAANLGWLMLVFNNMGITSSILHSNALASNPHPPFRSKSLVQIVDMLRSIPSSTTPVHRGGVCDPIPSFRTLVADIYNTVNGLTLRDVSGKSHGWALSKNLTSEPQIDEATRLDRMAAANDNYTVATEFPEKVLLQILSEIASLGDLHATARVNRAFYETYKTHELHLMKNILRVGRVRSGSQVPLLPKSSSNAEDKSLSSEVQQLADRSPERRRGSTAARSDQDDSDDSSTDDDSSDDELHIDTTGLDADAQQPPEYQTVNSSPVRSVPTRQISIRSSSTATEDETSDAEVSSRGRGQVRFRPLETSHYVDEEEPMTEEEAARILWPDSYDQPTLTPNTPTTVPEGLREKFRVNDQSFSEGSENKTLLTSESRELRQQAMIPGKKLVSAGPSNSRS